MAAGRMRSTRRLRSWIVQQVSSGKYPGLVWDDDAQTRFRIPWKHAGKHDFRKDEDAAIFKAWAEFKGKPVDGTLNNPAHWKTRLRCALNKSPEFEEESGRAQLDISEPYKVYRLIPLSEQGMEAPQKKSMGRQTRRSKKRQRSDSEDEDVSSVKYIKTEEDTPQQYVDSLPQCDSPQHTVQPIQFSTTVFQTHEDLKEIQLDFRIEENVCAPEAVMNVQDSFSVSVLYMGQSVLECPIHRPDVRITYLPSTLVPTPATLNSRFPPVPLPEPPKSLPAGPERQALFTLLPFMEKGVLLTSSEKGVYGKRYCQGRVFCIGPHCSGVKKMERNSRPLLLFSKDVFNQQLEYFRANGGEPPQCSITLCFGEELSDSEDLSKKLIIVQITLPWAEQQVKCAQPLISSISFLQSLANQSPLGEITLDLVAISPPTSDSAICGTA
ncbi:interferon regulatory factor 9 [Gouania willdenowi]|uniref:IRF tryptophan pentad repeat domain-containing protein n=1 Tax=Gouania willdenowi TaxID=441366 RepID=A0A8C5DDU5_GOUWI|nr:interferon regulatory factor 9 [Gouania willdenowi]